MNSYSGTFFSKYAKKNVSFLNLCNQFMFVCIRMSQFQQYRFEGMHETEDLQLTNCKIFISFERQLDDKCVFTLDNEM